MKVNIHDKEASIITKCRRRIIRIVVAFLGQTFRKAGKNPCFSARLCYIRSGEVRILLRNDHDRNAVRDGGDGGILGADQLLCLLQRLF